MFRLGIVHPRMLAALTPDFYASLCTIETATETNTKGSISKAWAALAGHIDLACRIAPSGGAEIRRPDMTYAQTSHTIDLAGHYPAIRPEMRAIISGTAYDIQAVEHDGSAAQTRLQAQIVST